MKVCPKCQKSYDDETLNFCLDDGSVLNRQEPASQEPPATVMMSNPAPTIAERGFPTTPTQPTWESAPKYEAPGGSGSKSWLWAVGILGAIILICGGGFVGLIAIGSFTETDDPPPLVKENTPADKDPEPAPKDTRKLQRVDDLSKWKINENEYISAEKEDDELVLRSQDKYYYVILSANMETWDASVKLTLRNTTAESSTLGYGLVIHSDPSEVLAKDYAFLIKSDTREYRIARHTNKNESNVVKWTRSSAIKSGTEVNELEVRTNGKDMSFYINGMFVRTEKDFSNYQMGVAGIYTSGDIPIAFQKLEYRK